MNHNEAFEVLLDKGIIYQPPEDLIFDWVDAMLDGDRRKSFSLYDECVRRGEAPLKMLLVLYQSTKRLLQVQSCDGNIEQVTGLEKWEINKVRDKANKAYSNRELIDMLFLIEGVEKGIKIGEVDEEFSVQYAMVNMLS